MSKITTILGFLEVLDIQYVLTSTTNVIFFLQHFLFMLTDFIFYFWSYAALMSGMCEPSGKCRSLSGGLMNRGCNIMLPCSPPSVCLTQIFLPHTWGHFSHRKHYVPIKNTYKYLCYHLWQCGLSFFPFSRFAELYWRGDPTVQHAVSFWKTGWQAGRSSPASMGFVDLG